MPKDDEVPKVNEAPKINEMSKGTDESHTESKDDRNYVGIFASEITSDALRLFLMRTFLYIDD